MLVEFYGCIRCLWGVCLSWLWGVRFMFVIFSVLCCFLFDLDCSLVVTVVVVVCAHWFRIVVLDYSLLACFVWISDC